MFFYFLVADAAPHGQGATKSSTASVPASSSSAVEGGDWPNLMGI